MTITICGSIKFFDDMEKARKQLETRGDTVLMPVKAQGVDYWSENNTSRVEAKKKFEFISEHMDKIERSDAILVINQTKGDIPNYVGANTFLEIGFAHYRKKKIYFLNPLPNQKYLEDELLTIDPVILHGDLNALTS